jgi:starch synthase
MHILQIASEITPIAKVGGLGDVLMGLTRELVWRGHHVLAVIPFYGCIDISQLTPDGYEERFTTICDGVQQSAIVTYYHITKDIPIALLDTERGYFRSRNAIYGGDSEVASFLMFSRAVVEWLLATGRQPDVMHLHDWPTAIVPCLYRALAKDRPVPPSVFTVHNFEYQGRCTWDSFARAGLSSGHFYDPSILQDPAHHCLNLVKAGLLLSTMSTTVSPTYAKEVKAPDGGTGLDTILGGLGDRFVGILNGLDYTFWNPQIDVYLSEKYSFEQLVQARSAKRRMKQHVCSSLGLSLADDVPFIVSVTRLVRQKGIYLIRDLLAQAEALNFQALVLGSVPEPEAQGAFEELDRFLRSKGRGAILLMSNESFAHQVYAASDMFVVPSLVEPCGLTQLIALKYGAVPIVRKTGGLADTIVDICSDGEGANGFVFDAPVSDSFIATASRAIDLYHDSERWEALMARGMTQDFSWHRPGDKYLDVYRTVTCSP